MEPTDLIDRLCEKLNNDRLKNCQLEQQVCGLNDRIWQLLELLIAVPNPERTNIDAWTTEAYAALLVAESFNCTASWKAIALQISNYNVAKVRDLQLPLADRVQATMTRSTALLAPAIPILKTGNSPETTTQFFCTLLDGTNFWLEQLPTADANCIWQTSAGVFYSGWLSEATTDGQRVIGRNARSLPETYWAATDGKWTQLTSEEYYLERATALPAVDAIPSLPSLGGVFEMAPAIFPVDLPIDLPIALPIDLPIELQSPLVAIVATNPIVIPTRS